MAVTAGTAAQVLLDEFNLHQFARTFTISPTIDIHDASVLGTTSRIKVAGIKHATASSELFVDDTALTGSYVVLKGKYGAATPGIITFAPQGFALGNRTLLMYAEETTFAISAIVDDLEKITFNAEASEDAVDPGVSLHAYAAETTSTNSASVDNAAATTNGGVGVIHATAISGSGSPTLTVKIQHSTNDSTWVDLVTFTALTAVGKQRVEVATGTTVNRYLRAISTISGSSPSFTYHVSFARR